MNISPSVNAYFFIPWCTIVKEIGHLHMKCLYQSQICTKLTTGHITVVGLLPFCSHIVHMSYILRLSTSMELQNFYFVLRVIRNLCTYPRNGIVIKFAFLPV